MLATMITPRFDSPLPVVRNVVSTVVLVGMAVMDADLGRKASWPLMHLGAAGVQLPLGPLIWFARKHTYPSPIDE